jgi:tRNA-intron endonuclease
MSKRKKAEEQKPQTVEAIMAEGRAVIWNREAGQKMFEEEYTGKWKEDRLELALVEAMLLLEQGRMTVKDGEGHEMNTDDFKAFASKKDPRFLNRYAVYKDLRSRSLPTRTGFKFGTDFRVYDRGVKPLQRGPKSAKEHTKWIVFAVAEGYTFSFPELSRAVRLAHNIRANMLWAVVSENQEVHYYQVTFFKP